MNLTSPSPPGKWTWLSSTWTQILFCKALSWMCDNWSPWEVLLYSAKLCRDCLTTGHHGKCCYGNDNCYYRERSLDWITVTVHRRTKPLLPAVTNRSIERHCRTSLTRVLQIVKYSYICINPDVLTVIECTTSFKIRHLMHDSNL
jgi:hypothetical protein